MAPLPLRIRIWDQIMRRTPAARLQELSDEEIVALRDQGAPEGRVRDAVFGAVVDGVESSDRPVPGGDGQDLMVRVYRPRRAAGPLPAVVHFHGGGFAFGDLDMCDHLGSVVARDVGAVVVAPDYRLAPTFPFPAPVTDAFAVLRWVAETADELGVDADRMAVMGDSAGGNLAAVVSLMAREEGGPALRGQALLYPVTDQRGTSDSRRALADAPILTSAMMDRFGSMYLPDPDDALEWRASPLLAESLVDLPSALVQTAEHDPLRDEGREYARALADAGVPVRHTEYQGMPHGFHTFPGLVGLAGAQARHELGTFLRTALAATGQD